MTRHHHNSSSSRACATMWIYDERKRDWHSPGRSRYLHQQLELDMRAAIPSSLHKDNIKRFVSQMKRDSVVTGVKYDENYQNWYVSFRDRSSNWYTDWVSAMKQTFVWGWLGYDTSAESPELWMWDESSSNYYKRLYDDYGNPYMQPFY